MSAPVREMQEQVAVGEPKRTATRFAPLTVCAAAIAWLSLTPDPRNDADMVGFLEAVGGELWAHGIAWGALALTARWAGIAWGTRRRSCALAWVLCVGYGILMEALQHFVPGRGAQFMDLLADVAGAGVGVLVMDMWLNRNGDHGQA